MKKIVKLMLVALTSSFLVFIPSTSHADCSPSDVCWNQDGGWAVVNPQGLVVNIIICKPSVCAENGEWKGKLGENRLVLQTGTNKATGGANPGWNTGNGITVTESNGTFTVSEASKPVQVVSTVGNDAGSTISVTYNTPTTVTTFNPNNVDANGVPVESKKVTENSIQVNGKQVTESQSSANTSSVSSVVENVISNNSTTKINSTSSSTTGSSSTFTSDSSTSRISETTTVTSVTNTLITKTPVVVNSDTVTVITTAIDSSVISTTTVSKEADTTLNPGTSSEDAQEQILNDVAWDIFNFDWLSVFLIELDKMLAFWFL